MRTATYQQITQALPKAQECTIPKTTRMHTVHPAAKLQEWRLSATNWNRLIPCGISSNARNSEADKQPNNPPRVGPNYEPDKHMNTVTLT
jgi:hypothetical protein